MPQHRPRSAPAAGQGALGFSRPRTIDYRCKRCGLVGQSKPLPNDPRRLAVYGLPEGWTLGSEHERERDPNEADFCWCVACTEDVRRGYPEDLGDLGRAR